MQFSYSKMILIVDSNYHSAQITSRQFQTWGFSVDVAHSPAAALKMLETGEVYPDMIFVEMPSPTDVMLTFPGRAHSNALWKSIPIVARCSGADRNCVFSAVENGYRDVVVRPTEPDVLREKIEKVLRHSISINDATFSVPISEKAIIPLEIELTGLSEFGVEGFCNQSLLPNSIIRMKCDFLAQFGLDQCCFRVVGCEETRAGAGKLKVALTFLGLRPQSAKLIRQFALSRSAKLLAAA